MPGSLSDGAELLVLEHIVGKTSYTMPTVAIALYTTAPTDSTAGTEVTNANAYARVATSGLWGTAAAGQIANSGAINFPTPTGSWGTVVAAALVTSATYGAGSQIAWTSFTGQAIGTGNTVSFAIGALVITLD